MPNAEGSKKRVAIVGGGISGLVCAHLLHPKYDITLFDEKLHLGGHSYTHQVHYQDDLVDIDMGLLLFHKKANPTLIQLFNELGVPLEACDLSFSYDSTQYLNYTGKELGNPFYPRSNLLAKRSYALFLDILKFNTLAKYTLNQKDINQQSFYEFALEHKLSDLLLNAYLYPLLNILWSASKYDLKHIPILFVLEFMNSYGLLSNKQRSSWLFLRKGAKSYSPILSKPFKDKIIQEFKIKSILRNKYTVVVEGHDSKQEFDAVILATRADQALKMIENPSPLEEQLLNNFKYVSKSISLHLDDSLMPKKKKHWASLNYLHDRDECITYHANRVQKFDAKTNFFLTIADSNQTDKDKELFQSEFIRLAFNDLTVHAQTKYAEINGLLNTYYCGAYWGYGQHEDAVKSAYRAVKSLEQRMPA